MRLTHAATSYPLVDGGSTAPFMEEMMVALNGAGHQVSIVVPRVHGLIENSRLGGVRVVGAPYAPARLQNWGYGKSLDEQGRIRRSATLMTPVAMASMTRAVHRELRDFADLAHMHWILPVGAIALTIPESIPVVVSVHGADARVASGRLQPLARRVLERADAVVAASSAILRGLSKIFAGTSEKSWVIPHGANGTLFRQYDQRTARNDLGVAQDRKLVLGIGRLVKKKGFANLVETRRAMDYSAVELVIVGEGPERSALLGIDPRVNLIGEATRHEVAMWMAAADVVAIPSIDVEGDVDSGPVVLMEAMAAGTCVVATRIGMAPDVVVDGVNGYLANSSDPAELAGLIAKALKQSDKLGQGAAATFERMGDWSRVAEDLEEVYESAIDSRSVKSR